MSLKSKGPFKVCFPGTGSKIVTVSSGESDFEQFANGRRPVQMRKRCNERSDDNVAAYFARSQIDNTQASEGGRLVDNIVSIRRDVLDELRYHAEESQYV